MLARHVNEQKEKFQVGVVHGGAGACGDERFPDIYVRLDSWEIFNFIRETLSGKPPKNGNIMSFTAKCI